MPGVMLCDSYLFLFPVLCWESFLGFILQHYIYFKNNFQSFVRSLSYLLFYIYLFFKYYPVLALWIQYLVSI